ncbi:MAG TPA: SDR family NAD(P)-dependent oxidoreductase [Cryptosporangiaceae bacterium]|nr:SDR family NAD(P)-dependent oxidoreductase [Cryptosporangiaceae bacterium]
MSAARLALGDKVALVTGASRGIGRGVALGLGEAGATVYVTGRTTAPGTSAARLPGTVTQTAEAVTAGGGRGVAVPCDHGDDAQVQAVFDRITAEHRRLDVLVNSVWGGYERFTDGTPFNGGPFWEQPLALWDSMHRIGVRAHYVAASLAAPLMVARGSGLIVNISSFAARVFVPPVPYGVAHAAIDRMTADMAAELRPRGVAVVSLYPGLARTESVLANAEHFDLSNSESPQLTGRAVAALVEDPDVMAWSGSWLVTAELARRYGFSDVDGRQPESTRRTVLAEHPEWRGD